MSPSVLAAVWDKEYLRGRKVIGEVESDRPPLRVVDLFCGCGGMSLGVRLAAEALGLRFEAVLAADFEEAALGVYEKNLDPRRSFNGDLAEAIHIPWNTDGGFQSEPELRASEFTDLGQVDLLVGGPPCQGHSDLNNHSRREDPKNSLYVLMAAYAAVLKPKAVVIENVPPVRHDRAGVLDRTRRLLKASGYDVRDDVITISEYGIAQRRKRHVLVARKGPELPSIEDGLKALKLRDRSVHWAISDLGRLERKRKKDLLDTASRQSKANHDRIRYLLRWKKYDLPNPLRPECHHGDHSYVSMYGRLRSREPAQTITGGFGSPGQGRFIHPRYPRTITPHEAARLQFFPDSFVFEHRRRNLLRRDLAQMIGNAVPAKLAYVLALFALS